MGPYTSNTVAASGRGPGSGAEALGGEGEGEGVDGERDEGL